MNGARPYLHLLAGFALILLTACASAPLQPPCPGDRLDIANCPPPDAVADGRVATEQHERRWHSPKELKADPIQLGMEAKIPIHQARMRVIGSSYDDSLRSLATKIWLIDNAEYTVDAAYYIFKRDLVGYAFLGALCDAVKRGVDVRLMVDSLGSINARHTELKALENCAIDAGFVKNTKGEVTTTKARVQTVIFNAFSNVFVNFNRRSHDKLLVVDGNYPEHAWAMTGGRNISLSYYGLHEDGSQDPTAYKDMEILVRPEPGAQGLDSIGLISETYFSILFSYQRNKRLSSIMAHTGELNKFETSLAKLRAMPDFQIAYQDIPAYVSKLRCGKVLLAHELGNLENENVVGAYDENLMRNPNSIMNVMDRLGEATNGTGVIRIVSPYFFISRYERKDGTVYFDDMEGVQSWLDAHPENSLEIVTNSVLTSDNFFAQAIIDMDTAPRLLLDPDTEAQWQDKKLKKMEDMSSLVASKKWQELVSNSRIKVYQTGRADSVQLGGDVYYGKLHAKFVLGTDNIGFVGTSNFDDRSKLYNNEMGYFFESEALSMDLIAEFERLKSQSYLWGSPEWLAMRKKLVETNSTKGKWTNRQRSTFARLYASGLHWQF
ncbi:MAG: phospholipase D-like domain-containing protein [Halioglobus sp.]